MTYAVVTSPSPEASASNEKLPLASAVVDPDTTPEKLTVMPLAAASPTLPLRWTMRPLPVGVALNDTLGAESLTVAEPEPPCPQGSVTEAVMSPSPEASASNEKLPLASAVVDPDTTPEKLTVMPLAAASPTLPLRWTMRPLPVGVALNDTLGAESLTVAEPEPPCPQGSVTEAVISPSPDASASNEKLPLASAVVDRLRRLRNSPSCHWPLSRRRCR